MWDNIGEKIKLLAKIIAWVGIISSVIGGSRLISQGFDMNQSGRGGELFIFLGIASLIGGSIISWISSFFMYGFGELIKKTAAIEQNTRNGTSPDIVQNNAQFSNGWVCKKCNYTNYSSALFCNSCGEKK